MTTEERIKEVLAPLVEEMRYEIFRPEYADSQSVERILGVIVSKFLRWDGDAIIEVARAALVDANFHGEAEKLEGLLA
jgi:ribosome maturation factor RimP